MPRVYFLPGIGGSSLGTTPLTTGDTWVSYTALALGQVGRLRLAPDGVNPGRPDGVPLYAGQPLVDYYNPAITALQQQLVSKGYTVVPYGYDWRLDAQALGGSLASVIRANESAAQPCTIVAHSYGGLVARMCWQSLGVAGAQDLVRRIITLGTPHWGSYGATKVWSLDYEGASQITILSAATLAIYGLPTAAALGLFWPADRLSALASTWPALYWTLPSLLAPDAAGDPHRGAIYSFSWPVNRGVSSAWLSAATGMFQPLLASPATQPPAWVQTSVAGIGLPVRSRIVNPSVISSAVGYSEADDGDGTVTTAGALLAEGAQYTVAAAHMDLPRVTGQSGQLADMVLDSRGPPTPPPPPMILAGQLGFVSAGPPSPFAIVGSPPIPKDP